MNINTKFLVGAGKQVCRPRCWIVFVPAQSHVGACHNVALMFPKLRGYSSVAKDEVYPAEILMVISETAG
jgi:hypothetical protein